MIEHHLVNQTMALSAILSLKKSYCVILSFFVSCVPHVLLQTDHPQLFQQQGLGAILCAWAPCVTPKHLGHPRSFWQTGCDPTT